MYSFPKFRILTFFFYLVLFLYLKQMSCDSFITLFKIYVIYSFRYHHYCYCGLTENF